MNLDVHTLFLVTIWVEAILGLLLLFAWVQNANIGAVAWWGCAHLIRASCFALFGMLGSVADAISIDLANVLLLIAYAVTWTGARVFYGRKPQPAGLIAGALLWLAVSHLPHLAGALDVRFPLASGIITTYTWLAAYEFWRGRGEPLVSRWPAIFLLVAHGCLFLLRSPFAATLPWAPSDPVLETVEVTETVWPTVLSFEALLFTIAIAFILLAMAKERTEFRHRIAAMVDPLTGIANRRSFFHDATELARRPPAGIGLLAVLVIDLDQFKSINDRFGHAVGDRVLQVFAQTATQSVRASDLVGRLGGEEFAAVLLSADRDQAVGLAEQIRSSFARAAAEVEGHPVRATLSIGMVFNDTATADLPQMLAQADRALYCAKTLGRNRVEVASPERVALKEAREQRAPSRSAA